MLSGMWCKIPYPKAAIFGIDQKWNLTRKPGIKSLRPTETSSISVRTLNKAGNNSNGWILESIDRIHDLDGLKTYSFQFWQ